MAKRATGMDSDCNNLFGTAHHYYNTIKLDNIKKKLAELDKYAHQKLKTIIDSQRVRRYLFESFLTIP